MMGREKATEEAISAEAELKGHSRRSRKGHARRGRKGQKRRGTREGAHAKGHTRWGGSEGAARDRSLSMLGSTQKRSGKKCRGTRQGAHAKSRKRRGTGEEAQAKGQGERQEVEHAGEHVLRAAPHPFALDP
eukprot:2478576-Rhodomonas_salina.1